MVVCICVYGWCVVGVCFMYVGVIPSYCLGAFNEFFKNFGRMRANGGYEGLHLVVQKIS